MLIQDDKNTRKDTAKAPIDDEINFYQLVADPRAIDKTLSHKAPKSIDEDDATQKDIGTPEEPLAPQSRRQLRRRIMSLEVPVFLLFLALLLSGSVMTNQELYQTCVAVYQYNKSTCEPLRGIIPKTEETKIIEKQIQPYVAKISMASSILHNVWPGILVLFVGPWSDKFGRRPILLLSFTGAFLGHVLTAILISISEILALNPWFYLLGSVPSVLVGGACTMSTIVFCYVADVSDEVNMPKRMFYVEMAIGIGALVGSVLSSYVLSIMSVPGLFLTSAALIFMAFLYVYFYIGESLDVEEKRFSHAARNFFDVQLIKDLINTCAMRRPNYGRAIISCVICISMLSNIVMHGEHDVFYLFVRNKFNVTLRQYTYYHAIIIAIKIIGCGVAFGLFRRILKLSCSAVCLLSIIGNMMCTITRALAQHFWLMYLAATLSFMSAITTPMLQTIVSIVVPSNEIGKVFSLSSFFQTISPLIASPLYTVVYNNTLNFYPGLFNFISTGLCGMCFISMMLVFMFEQRVKRKMEKETTMETGIVDNKIQIKATKTDNKT